MTQEQQLIDYLTSFVTENKLERINSVLEQRTRFLSVILEDIYQPHNASAVIRSCECFGIQDLYVIEQNNRYRNNPDITLGSKQWISFHRAKKTTACLQQLKDQGYQIVATSLRDRSTPIEDFKFTQKTALLFGTEETGLSNAAHELADATIKIPMYGFTQSFNISVSAALCLYTLRQKLMASDLNWHLSEEERQLLKIKWLTQSIPNGEKVKQTFFEKQNKEKKDENS